MCFAGNYDNNDYIEIYNKNRKQNKLKNILNIPNIHTSIFIPLKYYAKYYNELQSINYYWIIFV